MITQCPVCAKTLSIRDEYIGRLVRCPCGETLSTAELSGTPDAAPKTSTQRTSKSSSSDRSNSRDRSSVPAGPIFQTCACGIKLRIPETALGKKVRCQCGNTFIASAPDPSSPPPEKSKPAPMVVAKPIATPVQQERSPLPSSASQPLSGPDWFSELPQPMSTPSYAQSAVSNPFGSVPSFGALQSFESSPSYSASYPSVSPSQTSEKSLAADYLRDAKKEMKQKKRSDQAPSGWAMEANIWNGSVLGGLGAMAVAVVWFFAGLYFNRIFFYPPILFVIGLVGFFRGLLDGE